jgi:hypothetical protein
MKILIGNCQLVTMPTTTLHIKNMVCFRCTKVVEDELTILGCPIDKIKLVEVSLKREMQENDTVKLLKC